MQLSISLSLTSLPNDLQILGKEFHLSRCDLSSSSSSASWPSLILLPRPLPRPQRPDSLLKVIDCVTDCSLQRDL